MNCKAISMYLRTNHFLKGKLPCFVTIYPNTGKIYSEKKAHDYVMTITKENTLYFHGITKFMRVYDPKADFQIRLSAIEKYVLEKKNKYTKNFVLSTKDGLYVPLEIIVGLKNTYESESNLNFIMKEMESLGIKNDSYITDNE